ncbi:MAG: cupin domain-containing protein, partial [Desulfobacterales bacterium]|nr:cupin domain-containing protein [Desulfobacterales bacterium]
NMVYRLQHSAARVQQKTFYFLACIRGGGYTTCQSIVAPWWGYLSSYEHCYISEVANDSGDELVSISRARVEPGVTTAWHRLKGVSERYLIIAGGGLVEVQGLDKTNVSAGDVVRIPPDTPQRITNTGKTGLGFLLCLRPTLHVGLL